MIDFPLNIFLMKVLASEKRIEILRLFDRRRMTLSEIARELSLSPSTVGEHLDQLVRAGLIVQEDENHRWKYYALTEKGILLVHNPEDLRIVLALSKISFTAMVAGICTLLANWMMPAGEHGVPVQGGIEFSHLSEVGVLFFALAAIVWFAARLIWRRTCIDSSLEKF
jgi:DNA-binding transcriptional ArsR family regulator